MIQNVLPLHGHTKHLFVDMDAEFFFWKYKKTRQEHAEQLKQNPR